MRSHPLLRAALLATSLAAATRAVSAADGPAASAAPSAMVPAPSPSPSPVPATVFSFAGSPYVHRWSHAGQNEFTPPAQADLSRWQDMVTVQLYDKVRNADELAFVADSVLLAYRKSGRVVRSASTTAVPDLPAEHMVVAVLHDKGLREMVFARFRLTPDGGQALVYSHRVYGLNPDDEAGKWFRANDPAIAQAMMAWTDIPSVTALRALPQSP